MKKKFSLLLTLLAFLICGCGTKDNTSSGNISLENSNPTSQNESKFEWNTLYSSTSWDENVVDLIGVIAGDDCKELIPGIDAKRLDYYLTVDTSTISIAVINCYVNNLNTIVDDYEYALTICGFQLSYDSPYGWMEVSATEELVVQYSILEDLHGTSYFELIIYRVEMRMSDWPTDYIGLVTAEDIPVFDAKAYEASTDYNYAYQFYVLVCVYYPEITLEQYESKLISAGYTIGESYYGSEAVSKLGTRINYYEDYDGSIILMISNDWPYLDIMAYLGMDLPRLDDDNAVMSYSYVGDSNYSNLTIYYDYVGSSALATYGHQLEEIGFTQYGNEYTNKNTYTITTREYTMNLDQKDEHYIVLMYCLEMQMLAIVVYY